MTGAKTHNVLTRVESQSVLRRAWRWSMAAALACYLQLQTMWYLSLTGDTSWHRMEVWFYTSIGAGLVVLPMAGFLLRRNRCNMPCLVGFLLCAFSIGGGLFLSLTPGPAIFAFERSKDGFEHIAANVRAGRPQHFPQRLGVFTVVSAAPTLESEGVYIRVSKTYGGGAGFLWSPTLSDEGMGFNLNPGDRIGDTAWFYSEED